MYSNQDIQRIEDFHKYARFICGQFDIEVQLDSTKAETNGRVISVPNIVGMSNTELDMMYFILLHEAGHIKYSLFTEEAFLKIKSKAHAYLANAIEDARIENLLMRDFGGAKDMVEGFYCGHVVNRRLMKKVFQITGKRPDVFHCLGIYIHNYLLKARTAPFSRIATRVSYRKVKEFILQHNINKLLDHAPLKNWGDVVNLTNTIYDLFSQQYPDKSEKFDFAQDKALKKSVENRLAKLKAETIEAQTKMEANENAIIELSENLDTWDRQYSDEVNDKLRKAAKLGEDISNIDNEINQRKTRGQLEKNYQAKQQLDNSLPEKIKNLKESIEQVQAKISKGTNARGQSLTPEQQERLSKNLQKKQEQLKTLQKKVEDMQKELARTKSALDEFLKDYKPLKGKEHLNEEELKAEQASLKTQKEKVEQEYQKIMEQRQKIEREIIRLQNEINAVAERIQTKLLDTMYSMDSELHKNGMEIEMLPGFESTPGWEEADIAQKQFDKKASEKTGSIVRNGGRMGGFTGSDLRDLAVYIDTQLEKVKQIDLAKIFEKKIGTSRLEEFEEGSDIINNHIDQSVLTHFGSIQKHTVLTTQFDTVKDEHIAQDRQALRKLQSTNAEFITSLKRLFARKFKFTKKDYYRGGKEEGQLDARNLWKLPTKQGEDYFEINDPKVINKMAASILIDISGSHETEQNGYGEKLKVLALALSESLSGVHIKHEILGYHAPVNDQMREADPSYLYNRRSNSLETVIYKNFNQKDAQGLVNLEIQASDNSDGESIRIALQRLKKERSRKKALFIITDCKPFLSHGDMTILDEDLKAALREAVNQKIEVFAFGFNPNGKEFFAERFCYVQQYKDVLSFCDKMNLKN